MVPMRSAVVKDENGNACTTTESQHDRWRRHFNNMLNIQSEKETYKVTTGCNPMFKLCVCVSVTCDLVSVDLRHCPVTTFHNLMDLSAVPAPLANREDCQGHQPRAYNNLQLITTFEIHKIKSTTKGKITYRQTNKQTNKQTDKQADRQTGRQTNRWTDKQSSQA